MTLRDRLAEKFGVSPQRKADIYFDLARSTTLSDPVYWLQTLFAAGIATLGLALNSPAVIIGAMLISPLMGPILACGLALAAGDLILGLRAVVNLILSCLLAVAFAFLLVTVLPFKEITAEIAARTHPNTLDLVVALFSGAIGSIATSKEVKGVITSIPGVAIAVALMPPLGVVGYGAAIAAGVNMAEGIQVARGGGLLFLTNLVAITFTAMLVFLVLQIDIPAVQEQVEEWHQTDTESLRFRTLFKRLPGVPGVRHVGTLPSRVFMILVLILVILIPLSRSFNQLRQEISNQQKENRIRRVVAEEWQKDFGKLPNGQTRCYLDQVSINDRDGKLTLLLRVLTTKPLTIEEKEQFKGALSATLERSPNSLVTQIIEIPTTSAELIQKPLQPKSPEPLTVAQMQATLLQRIDEAISALHLPPPALLVDYQILNQKPQGLDIALTYLSERDIEADAQTVLVGQLRDQLDYPATELKFERLPVELGRLSLRSKRPTLDVNDKQILDKAAGFMTQHRKLQLEIGRKSEPSGSADAGGDPQMTAVREYLSSRWQITSDRVGVKLESVGDDWSLRFSLSQQ